MVVKIKVKDKKISIARAIMSTLSYNWKFLGPIDEKNKRHEGNSNCIWNQKFNWSVFYTEIRPLNLDMGSLYTSAVDNNLVLLIDLRSIYNSDPSSGLRPQRAKRTVIQEIVSISVICSKQSIPVSPFKKLLAI
jgi:hypothetical protein